MPLWFDTALLVVVAGLLGCLAVLMLRLRRTGRDPVDEHFQPGDGAGRLKVLESAAVDADRRLVLVRRDDVEHLIMIGGPSDMVVEHDLSKRAAAHWSPARTASGDGAGLAAASGLAAAAGLAGAGDLDRIEARESRGVTLEPDAGRAASEWTPRGTREARRAAREAGQRGSGPNAPAALAAAPPPSAKAGPVATEGAARQNGAASAPAPAPAVAAPPVARPVRPAVAKAPPPPAPRPALPEPPTADRAGAPQPARANGPAAPFAANQDGASHGPDEPAALPQRSAAAAPPPILVPAPPLGPTLAQPRPPEPRAPEPRSPEPRPPQARPPEPRPPQPRPPQPVAAPATAAPNAAEGRRAAARAREAEQSAAATVATVKPSEPRELRAERREPAPALPVAEIPWPEADDIEGEIVRALRVDPKPPLPSTVSIGQQRIEPTAAKPVPRARIEPTTTLGDLAERLEEALAREVQAANPASIGRPERTLPAGEFGFEPPSFAPSFSPGPTLSKARLEGNEMGGSERIAPSPQAEPRGPVEVQEQAPVVTLNARRREPADPIEDEMARLLGELTGDTTRR